jgi:hypothetical protein
VGCRFNRVSSCHLRFTGTDERLRVYVEVDEGGRLAWGHTARFDPFDWLCTTRRVQQHQLASALKNNNCGVQLSRLVRRQSKQLPLPRSSSAHSSGYVPTLVRRRRSASNETAATPKANTTPRYANMSANDSSNVWLTILGGVLKDPESLR